MKNPCETCEAAFDLQRANLNTGKPYVACLCVPRLEYLQRQEEQKGVARAVLPGDEPPCLYCRGEGRQGGSYCAKCQGTGYATTDDGRDE